MLASGALWRVRESGMRTRTFRTYDRDSLLLMPPSLHDRVDPEGLPAFLIDLVDELDLAPFLAARHVPARSASGRFRFATQAPRVRP